MCKLKLKLGHSPDADDAFMFYGLAKGLIDAEGLEFEHILKDIQTLNEWALEGRVEITAVSFYAYTQVWERYAVLSAGASVGDDYGPMIVTAGQRDLEQIKKEVIAVPGEMTTAFLVLKLALGDVKYKVMPFDKIMEAVGAGEVKAGLIIHEGQLTYSKYKLYCAADLGKWWYEQTGLPLPLGCNLVRRDLGSEVMAKASRVLKKSIEYSLANREKALEYALGFTPHLDRGTGDKFISMYVNGLTLELGERGRQGVSELLNRSASAGLSNWPKGKAVEFI